MKTNQTSVFMRRKVLVLLLAAWSLMRSKGNLRAYLRRQRSRLGAPKSVMAAGHKLARIFHTVKRYGKGYRKRSEEEFVIEHRIRMEKNLHRREKEPGCELRKIETPAETGPQPA